MPSVRSSAPRRGAEQDSQDESELGHQGDDRREGARGAGRSVVRRIRQVGDLPDAVEDDRHAHRERHGDGHENAAFA